jgi:DamX protein
VDRATQDAEVARTESSATLGTEPAAATTPSTTAAAVAQAPTDTDSTLADPETTTEAGAPPRQVRVSDDTLLVGDQPYALQLFGFSSQAGMLRFARRKDLPPRVYYREERYRDRPWFVLIHSLHAGYRDAAAVQAQLPSDLATLDTWIRELPAETKLSILEISP